jgi:hypothetical protein
MLVTEGVVSSQGNTKGKRSPFSPACGCAFCIVHHPPKLTDIATVPSMNHQNRIALTSFERLTSLLLTAFCR